MLNLNVCCHCQFLVVGQVEVLHRVPYEELNLRINGEMVKNQLTALCLNFKLEGISGLEPSWEHHLPFHQPTRRYNEMLKPAINIEMCTTESCTLKYCSSLDLDIPVLASFPYIYGICLCYEFYLSL